MNLQRANFYACGHFFFWVGANAPSRIRPWMYRAVSMLAALRIYVT